MVPEVKDTGPFSVSVFVPTESTPDVNVSVPDTVSLFPSVPPLELFSVTLLKVIAVVPPIVWAVEPPRLTRPELCVNVAPEFVKLPVRFSVPEVEVKDVVLNVPFLRL